MLFLVCNLSLLLWSSFALKRGHFRIAKALGWTSEESSALALTKIDCQFQLQRLEKTQKVTPKREPTLSLAPSNNLQRENEMAKYNDDEVIARALQEEYDREMSQRRNNQSSSRRAPPPPPAVTASAPSEDTIRGRRGTETDEEYARRLAREEERLYRFYQKRQSGRDVNNNGNTRDPSSSRTARENLDISASSRDPPGANNNYSPEEAASNAALFGVKRSDSDITPATSREGSALFEDEEYARRVEQEIHDEEIARRMQESDENRASRYMAREVALAPAPRYSFKCFCSWLISFTIIAAGVIAFAYFFYIQDNGSPRNWIWDPSEFADEDVSKDD